MTAKEQLQAHFAPHIGRWRARRAPYVWPLCLSEAFYRQADVLLGAAVAAEGGCAFLADADCAPVALIMIAEWYKREYTGSLAGRPAWVKDTDWERVWRNCGVRNWQRWVYAFGDRGRSWVYSAMVLGGLACAFEQHHDSGNRLMRDLCRLFHDEDDFQPDASERARALEQSIEQRGSIYRFITELTDPASALSQAYECDTQAEVRNLRATIVRINREVIQTKLQSEWMVTTSPYQPDKIVKNLRVCLRSENVGGERRWFLSRRRAAEWGFTNVDRISEITVAVRFYRGGEPVGADADVLHFQTTGKSEAGFNTVEPKHMGTVSKFPDDFDAWRVVARSDDGQEVDVDAKLQPVGEFNQLYQTAGDPQLWGSGYRRRPSVVVFSDRCRVTDPAAHPVSAKSVLVDYQPRGQLYWAEIPAFVTLRYPLPDGEEREVRLRSPLAGCRVVVRQQFPDLFNLLPGGEIAVFTSDPETGEETFRTMPLMFGLPRLCLSWSEEGKEPSLLEAEETLYRQHGAETAPEDLREGIVEVTVLARGLRADRQVWYMPDAGKEQPLERRPDRRCALWADGRKVAASDPDASSGLMPATLTATRHSRWHDRAEFGIWQPVLRREVFIGGKLRLADDSADPLYVAALNAMDMKIRIFDARGYYEWIGAREMDAHRKLIHPQSDTSPLNRGNVFLYNSRADLKPDPAEAKKYGSLTMLPDPEGTATDYPEIMAEKPKGMFGPAPKGLDAREALKACISDNLYSYWFRSLRDLKGDVLPLLKEVLGAFGPEYILKKKPIIRRILWENNLTPSDLVKYGIKI